MDVRGGKEVSGISASVVGREKDATPRAIES